MKAMPAIRRPEIKEAVARGGRSRPFRKVKVETTGVVTALGTVETQEQKRPR